LYHAIEKNSQSENRKAVLYQYFDGIISNLAIMLCAYVGLIVLGTVFSMVWYKLVMQRSQVTHEILHVVPLKGHMTGTYMHSSCLAFAQALTAIPFCRPH